VIAAAYEYAENPGATPPRWLVLKRRITDYGVEAIMGRSWLGVSEIAKMEASQRVVGAYVDRQKSQNWAEWAKQNPADAELLALAARITADG